MTRELFLILLLGLVVIASGVDLVTDLSEGIGADHIIQEAAVVILSVLAIIWLALGLRRQRYEIQALERELTEAKNFAKSANQNVLSARRQLSETMSKQFTEWELSRSEQEISWLLIKGLSLKEIAAIRNTSEKTVRQQASAVYSKAGVTGRHGFAAWFIEDLL